LRYCHTQTHEVNGRGIVAGHQYQLLRYVSETHSSWAMPLANDRLNEHDTQADLGAEQLQRFSMTLGADMPCLSGLRRCVWMRFVFIGHAASALWRGSSNAPRPCFVPSGSR
jgi:hypothetical protein